MFGLKHFESKIFVLDEVMHYFYICLAIHDVIKAHIDTLEDRFRRKPSKEKIYEFGKTSDSNQKPNDIIRMIFFHDYPAALRHKDKEELHRFTNMLITIKSITDEQIRNKQFRPLRYEILDKIERSITFMENIRNRPTPRKYMISTKQYKQDGRINRRVMTTTNIEKIKIRKRQVKWTILNYAEMSYKQYRADFT